MFFQAVAKGMIERGSGGAIVMLSSLSSTIAVNNQPVYTTTKAAMDQLTRCLAIELGPHKVIFLSFCHIYSPFNRGPDL